jgi:peptide-methionine (R)-S-oxide reductase
MNRRAVLQRVGWFAGVAAFAAPWLARSGSALAAGPVAPAPSGPQPNGPQPAASKLPKAPVGPVSYAVQHTDAEWQAMLEPLRYWSLREDGTEPAYTSDLLKEHRTGAFTCAGCEQKAFSSADKYDSHTGWPSFWQPIPDAIATREDRSLGMIRTEVHCTRCGSHLGHVFEDGPPPTYLRYCINGLSIHFVAA